MFILISHLSKKVTFLNIILHLDFSLYYILEIFPCLYINHSLSRGHSYIVFHCVATPLSIC